MSGSPTHYSAISVEILIQHSLNPPGLIYDAEVVHDGEQALLRVVVTRRGYGGVISAAWDCGFLRQGYASLGATEAEHRLNIRRNFRLSPRSSGAGSGIRPSVFRQPARAHPSPCTKHSNDRRVELRYRYRQRESISFDLP
jgi:hypothetical protein